MDLPDDIESEIASYLARELGERGPGRIRAADLRALGERIVDGVPMQVWAFPSIDGEGWATVEPMGDSYCIGLTRPPRGAPAGGYRLRAETEGGKPPLTLSLDPLDSGLYGTSSDVRFTTAGGQVLMLGAEVALVDGSEELSLSILAEDEVVLAVRACLPCVVMWAGCVIRVSRDDAGPA